MVSHVLHVHFALHHTQAAAVAAVRVHLHAGQGETVEKAVDRAQRADETAEGPVAENTGQADHDHDDPLVGEERAKLVEGCRVGRILQQADRSLKGARRTDILAEAWQNDAFSDTPDERDRDDEHRQENIFQPGKHPGDTALPDFPGRDPVQQFLDQAQGTDPAAYGTAQDDAEQRQNAHHIPGSGMPGGVQRVLQGTQGTAGDGAGAGITVESRHTGSLQVPGIDMSVNETF